MKTTIRTYKELEKFAKVWAGSVEDDVKRFELLIVIGPPGVLKSTIIKGAVQDRARTLEGTLSAFQLYRECYESLDQPIVIDDVDSLYADKAAVRLLKNLCNTEPEKTLGWHTAAPQLRASGIPREFKTRSPVCIIANEWKTANKNLGALENRGMTIIFDPSPSEVHARCRVDGERVHKEVYDFVGQYLPLIESPSMREYVNATKLLHNRLPWKQQLVETWGLTTDVDKMAFLQVYYNPALKTGADKVDAFKALTGHGQAEYYRTRGDLLRHGPLPVSLDKDVLKTLSIKVNGE